ncbi:hypothetical protein PROFUN_11668 [Planoprotostelium fungivorum]|uniref:Uncharacterized protein n=1 Tax=Planoprotostelium fungivorum TaxID=1890364 RepID=A0A2P6N591_9EUKA|nr:hypothetical protein PROFUN_11668 [Planoprotostelium fungivorum]
MDNTFVDMMTAMGEGFRVQIAGLQQKNCKLTEDLTKLQKECDDLRSTTKPDDAITAENQYMRGQLESLRGQIKNLRHQLEGKKEKKRKGKKRGPGRPRRELEVDSDSDVYSDDEEDDVEVDSEEERPNRVREGADTPPKRTRSMTASGSQGRMTRRSSINRQEISFVEDDDRDDEPLKRDQDDEELLVGPNVRAEDFFSNFKFPTENARFGRPESNKMKRRENLSWDFLVNNGVIQTRTSQQKPTPLFCRFLTRDDKPEDLIMWLEGGGGDWRLGSWMDKKIGDPKKVTTSFVSAADVRQRLGVVMNEQARRLLEVKIEQKSVWQHLSIHYKGDVKNLSEIQALIVDKTSGDRSVSSTPK